MWHYTLGAASSTVGSTTGTIVTLVGHYLEAVQSAGAGLARRALPRRTLAATRTWTATVSRWTKRFATLIGNELPQASLARIARYFRALTGAESAATASASRVAFVYRAFDATLSLVAELFSVLGSLVTIAAEMTGAATLARKVLAVASPFVGRIFAVAYTPSGGPGIGAGLSRAVFAFRILTRDFFISATLSVSSATSVSLAAVENIVGTLARTSSVFRAFDAVTATVADSTRVIISAGYAVLTLDAVAVVEATLLRQAWLTRALDGLTSLVAGMLARYGYFPFDPPLTCRCLVQTRTVRTA
jgi:hypothetical protein